MNRLLTANTAAQSSRRGVGRARVICSSRSVDGYSWVRAVFKYMDHHPVLYHVLADLIILIPEELKLVSGLPGRQSSRTFAAHLLCELCVIFEMAKDLPTEFCSSLVH